MFALASLAVGLLATFVAGELRGITPHDMYSSSIGVLGCKINTNRVAYWPMSVDCNNICVRVSYGGRSVDLLRIDQSGGAYDISYDAYNFLVSGQSATAHPITGGAVDMDVQNVAASNCVQHLKAGGLPLSASNSMNYVASCLGQPNSWVAKNSRLFNIQDPVCHWGYDEQCSVNLAVSNQPSCSHALGFTNGRLPDTVFNIQYGTGAVVAAPKRMRGHDENLLPTRSTERILARDDGLGELRMTRRGGGSRVQGNKGRIRFCSGPGQLEATYSDNFHIPLLHCPK